MSATPPGWYDDGYGALRWWDGAQWTEHVHVSEQPSVAGEPAQPAASMEQNVAPAAATASAAAGPSDPAAQLFAGPVDPQAPAVPAGDDTQIYGQPPAGYPGAGVGGAFISATEPKRSKLWIVWVIVGVVLLGIVALAAVFIPVALGLLQGTGGAAAGNPDEAAAVAAVEAYDSAWREGDCDAYVTNTTEDFREYLGIPDCELFELSAAEFAATTAEYDLTVTEIDSSGDDIVLQTRESYMTTVDGQGAPLDEPTQAVDVYTYVLVSEDGAWLIDDATVE